MVGMKGLKPPTSRSQSERSIQTELHPDINGTKGWSRTTVTKLSVSHISHYMTPVYQDSLNFVRDLNPLKKIIQAFFYYPFNSNCCMSLYIIQKIFQKIKLFCCFRFCFLIQKEFSFTLQFTNNPCVHYRISAFQEFNSIFIN